MKEVRTIEMSLIMRGKEQNCRENAGKTLVKRRKDAERKKGKNKVHERGKRMGLKTWRKKKKGKERKRRKETPQTLEKNYERKVGNEKEKKGEEETGERGLGESG